MVQKAGMQSKVGREESWAIAGDLGNSVKLITLLTVPDETVSNHTGGTGLHPEHKQEERPFCKEDWLNAGELQVSLRFQLHKQQKPHILSLKHLSQRGLWLSDAFHKKLSTPCSFLEGCCTVQCLP